MLKVLGSTTVCTKYRSKVYFIEFFYSTHHMQHESSLKKLYGLFTINTNQNGCHVVMLLVGNK